MGSSTDYYCDSLATYFFDFLCGGFWNESPTQDAGVDGSYIILNSSGIFKLFINPRWDDWLGTGSPYLIINEKVVSMKNYFC